MPVVRAMFGQDFNNPNNCRILYQRGTGQQNHIVTLFGADWNTVVGSGVVGVPGVPLESYYGCRIDLGSSYVGENGIFGALNLAITLKNASPSGQISSWTFLVDRPNPNKIISDPSNWWPSTFSIAPQDVSLSNIQSGVSVQVGTQATYQVNVQSQGNFAGNVVLTCAASGGLTCVGSTVTVPAGGSVNGTITVTAPGNAGAGAAAVTVSVNTGNGHTITQAATVTAVPIPPTVSFSASPTLNVPVGSYGIFTVTVTGNSTWPTGKTVLIRSLPASQYTGAGFWIIGPNGGGLVAANPTISVPGTFSYRVYDAANTVGNLRWGWVEAVDPSSLVQYSTSYLPIKSVSSGAPVQPVISVVSQITVPVGGSVKTQVGLSSSGVGNTSVALTVMSQGSAIATLSSPTLSMAAPVSVLIDPGSTPPGGSFDVNFSAPGLLTQTLHATVQGSSAVQTSLVSFTSSIPQC